MHSNPSNRLWIYYVYVVQRKCVNQKQHLGMNETITIMIRSPVPNTYYYESPRSIRCISGVFTMVWFYFCSHTKCLRLLIKIYACVCVGKWCPVANFNSQIQWLPSNWWIDSELIICTIIIKGIFLSQLIAEKHTQQEYNYTSL